MRKTHEKPVMVTRSSLPPLEEYVEMLKPIWDSAWLTNMGDYHETLKEQLKEYLGVANLELFVNGHMGLELALQAFQMEEGGEVITTPFSSLPLTPISFNPCSILLLLIPASTRIWVFSVPT